MNAKWDSYTHFPASGEEFERYVGTIFDDLGYKVFLTPRRNDYGVDLLLEEPTTKKRIAVQTKFYNKSSLGNAPVQEVLAGLPLYKAQVGWVITNGRFTENASNLAKANGVRLIDNDGLNELIDKAKACRKKAEFRKALSAETAQARSASTPASAASSKTPADFPLPSSSSSSASSKPSVASISPASDKAPTSVSASSAATSASDAAGASSPYPVVPRAYAPMRPPEPMSSARDTGGFQHIVVFSLFDVQKRWDCPVEVVMEQIEQGMPMIQLPHGAWGITQGDLFAWEIHVDEERQKRLKTQRLFSVLFIGAALIIFAICVILLMKSGFFG